MLHGTKLGAVAAGLIIAFGTTAHAQLQIFPASPGEFYLGGEGGWTSLGGEKNSVPGKSFPEIWKDGFNVGGRLGYEWGPWRFEEEFRFQSNDASTFTGHSVQGGRQAYLVMTNAIYDIALGWPISPHLGVGVGAVGLHDRVTAPLLGLGVVSEGTDWQLAYQAIAGLRYIINPLLAFDIDYRYLGTTTPHFRTPPGLIVDGAPAGDLTINSGYHVNEIVASLTLRFGAPRPPVAAPPERLAPAPIRRKVFLVFFDWDRDTITPGGTQIVQQAANAVHAGMPVTIEVTGYTDRSGSAGYNQRLSERRAANVANALARLGVPRQEMAVSGRGENDNHVPTTDGVREPQNRRVEIVVP